MACEGKGSATVDITAGSTRERVESSKPGVNVQISEFDEQSGEAIRPLPGGYCCDVAYRIRGTYTRCALSHITPGECWPNSTGTVDFEVFVTGQLLYTSITKFNGVPNAIELTRRGCNGIKQKLNLIGLSAEKMLSYSINSVDRLDGLPDSCSPPNPADFDKVCKITITDESGTIFDKEMPCPITYEVRCGDECKEGELKCKSEQYPGYCCIDCGSLSQKLKG